MDIYLMISFQYLFFVNADLFNNLLAINDIYSS